MCRYPISWEAFLNPLDSYFLFAEELGYHRWALAHSSSCFLIWGTYMKLVTKYQISVINSCWEKCDEKCTYMFNVYRNQLSRQTGSRNLMGPKTLPIIHQIPTSCLPTLLIFIHIEHICSFFVAFFSATIDSRNLIFGHKLHIGTPYRGKRFWTRQIPTSLPIIWYTYMMLVTKYQISAIDSCWEKCNEKWAYMFNVYKNQ
jgi:hypothetical protein